MAEKINVAKRDPLLSIPLVHESLQLNHSFVLRLIENLFGGVIIYGGLLFISKHNYLLFHSFSELMAIVIAISIYIFTRNTCAYMGNNYLHFIGISFLFMGVLDAVHMLAYEGMEVFVNGGTNLASQLWIAARYMQALAFLVAPVFFFRNFKSLYVSSGFLAITLLILGMIFYWRVFPTTYIPGFGLTDFKIYSEYLISCLFIAAVALLMLNYREFQPKILILLIMSILITVISEFAFTLYIDDTGFFNFLGHYLKIIAYYLLYIAILVTGLVEPFRLIFRKLKDNQEELRESMLELQARNDELDAFVHTVAHDLKGPLASVGLALKTLDNPGISNENRNSFRADIRTTVDETSAIIDSLLLLSTVRKTKVVKEKMDMNQIVSRVMQRLHILIEENQVQIHAPTEWPIVLGVPQWIEEVWVNYITNAIQHGSSPYIIEIGATAQPGNRVRFWVKDNGPGISQEYKDKLFVEFTQLKRLSQSGHGLGLSIVKRIITLLDGEVGAETRPGQGSTFHFTLPASKEEIRPGEGEF